MKNYNLLSFNLIIVVLFVGCNQRIKKQPFVTNQKKINIQNVPISIGIPDSLADYITQKVFDLKEVRQLDSITKKIYSKENKTEHVSLMIQPLPNYKKGYYWVQVGIDDTFRFRPVLNFLVDSLTFQVKYFDAGNDSIIPLSVWRKKPIQWK